MSDDFEIDILPAEKLPDKPDKPAQTGINTERAWNFIENNAGSVMEIVKKVADISVMNAATENELKLKKAKIEELRAETDSYIQKVNADTDSEINLIKNRAEVTKELLKQFRESGMSGVSAETFRDTLELVLGNGAGGSDG